MQVAITRDGDGERVDMIRTEHPPPKLVYKYMILYKKGARGPETHF